MINYEHILSRLPYRKPFLFVDGIDHVDTESISGHFYLNPDLDFYHGHFIQQPVTPGVILIEIMAQIGLVCLGIHLMQETLDERGFPFALSSSDVEFLKPVYPKETITVSSKKIYFRFGKLKCKIRVQNEKNELVCEGTLAGMLIKQNP